MGSSTDDKKTNELYEKFKSGEVSIDLQNYVDTPKGKLQPPPSKYVMPPPATKKSKE